ncbi:unnamed protein product [Rhizoctonia solani]|uniref:Uncharacterized protein n=1 Tax=Rhizoctonia solani TaxID=456999 RepID=A0A8H3HD41_9AGAM|nr:unnamed protein product [Rhizoctonia solani]CAE6498666.1 unnamed protein product [Rhizoctonia solani]
MWIIQLKRFLAVHHPSPHSLTHYTSGMHTLGVFSIVASIGLLSTGALGRPISLRVTHPYPVYRSDNLTELDFRTPGRAMPESRAHLGLSLAAFSKAIEVGFVNVVIRPHEHLVSFARYYETPKQLQSLPVAANQGWPTYNLKKRHSLDGSEESAGADSFPAYNRRRRGSDDLDAEAVRPPDYRRDTIFERSSTHAVAGEHLKPRKNALN